jgi:selenoprotein W-related protein
VRLTEALLSEHKNKLSAVNIIPSSGGVFEVKLNDELIFSKKSLGRFPVENEVENKLRGKI